MHGQTKDAETADSYTWLEDIHGARALPWVDAQTTRTLKHLSERPAFGESVQKNLALFSQREFNIQYPNSVGGVIYNHFRSATQPGGMWRSTSLEEYRQERPSWRPLLNLDAYNREQGTDWVWGGAQVQPPGLRDVPSPTERPRALIFLSRAGSDAGVHREFDTATRSFVPPAQGGFSLPEAKAWATWWSADELLVSSAALGAGSQTTSGYSRELRLLKRGQPLAQAPLLFKAEPTDMSIDWRVDVRPPGTQDLVVSRRIAFTQFEHHLWDGNAIRRLPLPAHTSVRLGQGHLTITTGMPWTVNGRNHAAGSFFIWPLAQAQAAARALTPADAIQPRLLFEPQGGESVLGFTFTQDHLALTILRDQQSRMSLHRLDGSAPPREVQGLGDFGWASLWPHSAKDNQLWLQHRSFLQPSTLQLLNTATGQMDVLHRQGAATDASPYRVERLWAKSKDGSQVPVTLIARTDVPRAAPGQGKQPTLLYGYGGFGLSVLPGYQRAVLVNWLDQGGTYAIAHIRGGAELGPAWELAARGIQRQHAYDDFIAVAEHLVQSGITSAKHLGMYGASNGGLLVAAVLMQRPDLFGAAVSRVPLTDLQRFTEWLAGPSWVQEYGDPAKPADWAVMRSYSPYHNLRPGVAYPPTLYMGNRNDDRVHPAHGRKMAAKQMALAPATTWYYEPGAGGHSGTTTPQLAAEREAVIYSFLMRHLAGR